MSFAPAPSSIIWPIAGIQNSAHVGLVNIATDHAGVPRYVPMIYRDGNSVVPSFVLAASAAALNTEAVLGETSLKLAARTAQLDLGHHLPVRYYGPHGSIRQFSALRALRGDLDPNEVRGQVVVLGATAVGLGDTFATPFDRSSKTRVTRRSRRATVARPSTCFGEQRSSRRSRCSTS